MWNPAILLRHIVNYIERSNTSYPQILRLSSSPYSTLEKVIKSLYVCTLCCNDIALPCFPLVTESQQEQLATVFHAMADKQEQTVDRDKVRAKCKELLVDMTEEEIDEKIRKVVGRKKLITLKGRYCVPE